MPRPRTLRVVAAGIAVGVLVPATAATAAGDVDVQATFEVTQDANGLSITVEGGSADLGSTGASFDSAGSVEGDLVKTTVTDARGALLGGWSVQVEALEAAIARTDGDGEVPLDQARVFFPQTELSGLVDTLGGALNGMTITDAQLANDSANLAAAYTLIEGTTTNLGIGEAPNVTYTLRMSVTVPAGTPAGEYSVTVRQTVSGS